jgi:hypothetical protein
MVLEMGRDDHRIRVSASDDVVSERVGLRAARDVDPAPAASELEKTWGARIELSLDDQPVSGGFSKHSHS